jgi:hypothetical protein
MRRLGSLAAEISPTGTGVPMSYDTLLMEFLELHRRRKERSLTGAESDRWDELKGLLGEAQGVPPAAPPSASPRQEPDPKHTAH